MSRPLKDSKTAQIALAPTGVIYVRLGIYPKFSKFLTTSGVGRKRLDAYLPFQQATVNFAIVQLEAEK